MKWEITLLTSNRENKPRPNQLVQATDCQRTTAPANATYSSEMCRAKVVSLLELNMNPQGNEILSIYSAWTPLYFCHLLLGHTSVSRGDLRWSFSELNCNEKLWLRSVTNNGGSQVSWGIPFCIRTPRGDTALFPMRQHCWLHSAAVSPTSALWGLREV